MTSATSDPSSANNKSTLVTAVAASADVSVTKTLASPASPVVGDSLRYVMTTANAGPSTASTLVITDTLRVAAPAVVFLVVTLASALALIHVDRIDPAQALEG